MTNKYLTILFFAKDKLLDGSDISTLTYIRNNASNQNNCNLDELSDVEN